MTAFDLQNHAPVRWALKSGNGQSTIGITNGLLLGEDERGDYEIDLEPTESALVRFDLEGDAITIQLVSRDWVLASDSRMLGDRYQTDRTVDLHLPNNTFRIEGGAGAGGEAARIELTRRPSVNWLRPVPRPPDTRADAEPGDDGLTLPDPIPEPGRVSAFLTQGGSRPRSEPGQAARVQPAPASAGLPGSAWRFNSVEAPIARPPRLRTVGPPRSRRRGRRRHPSQPGWPLTIALIVAYLGALMMSAPAHTPVTGVLPVEGSPEAQDLLLEPQEVSLEPQEASLEPQNVEALLDTVDALLQQQVNPDPATLQFAIEAYRAAAARRPDDGMIRARLEQLEAAGSDD